MKEFYHILQYGVEGIDVLRAIPTDLRDIQGCNKAQYLILSTRYHQIQEGLKILYFLIMFKFMISVLRFYFFRYTDGVIDKCPSHLRIWPGTLTNAPPRPT